MEGGKAERFTSERFFASTLDADERRIVEHLRLPRRVESEWREVSAATQLFVLRGAGAYEVTGEPDAKRVMAGDLVHVAPKTSHRFVAHSGGELVLMRILDPADGAASPATAPAPIRKLGVLGAGVMGSAIATHYCSYGLPTVIADLSHEQLEKTLAAAETYFGEQAKAASLLTAASSLEALANCDLILEAVFEDLDVKREALEALEAVAAEQTILATNTSSLTVADLSQGLKRPTRLIGLHYNNPAITNPVVECVPGAETDREVVRTCLSFLASTEKLPVVCKDVAGFALNRQSLPYINEAARCLDESLGSTHAIDDAATKRLGFGLGPFAIMNLVGTRVMASSILNLSVHGPLYQPAVSILEKGRTNASWEIVPSPPASEETKATIARRLRGALFIPTVEILTEGIASREDLEHICTDALGYPKSSVDMMREQGRVACEALVGETCQRFGMPPVAVDVVFRD